MSLAELPTQDNPLIVSLDSSSKLDHSMEIEQLLQDKSIEIQDEETNTSILSNLQDVENINENYTLCKLWITLN